MFGVTVVDGSMLNPVFKSKTGPYYVCCNSLRGVDSMFCVKVVEASM